MTASPSVLSPAIVLGLSPTGLYAIRELGRAGVAVTGFARETGPARASRHLDAAHVVSAEEAVARLQALAPAGRPKPVLIPTSDQDVELIQAHADALAGQFLFQGSYSDGAAERLMTKDRLYALCREIGIAVPQSWDVARHEVAGLAGDMRFPCLVKPGRIDAVKAAMAGRKLWTCPDLAAFKAAAAALPEGDTRWVIQEIVPGPESEITLWTAYRDGAGTIHQEATARKLRQFPPGFGSASLVRTGPEPETAAASRRLLEAADYCGIAATEFKRDPRDGQLKIIEMNPRPSLWFAVTTAAGKTITLAAWRDLTCRDLPPEAPQIDEVEWRYRLKDLWSALFYWRNSNFVLPPPQLDGLPRPARRTLAVGAWDDPMPTLEEVRVLGAKALRRAMRQKR